MRTISTPKLHILPAAVGFVLLLYMMHAGLVYAASIKIAWNPNRESDLSGYNVYYGTSSGHYGPPLAVGKVTSHEIVGLNAGERYYITLTAYDTSYNESAKSAEISGVALSTTTTTGTLTTTLPASTSSSAYTTTVVPTTTTTAAPSSTSSTAPPATTTTTSAGDNIASCTNPRKLQPVAVTATHWPRPLFPAENLIDGDIETAWSTFFTFLRKDASITLDMGSNKIITSLSLYASRIFGIDFLPPHIEMQISSDNNTWEPLSAGDAPAGLESTPSDSWNINGDNGRYIKICMSGRKSFFLFQLTHIAELAIYGCDETGVHVPFSLQGSMSSERADVSAQKESALNTQEDDAEPLIPDIPGRPIVSFQ